MDASKATQMSTTIPQAWKIPGSLLQMPLRGAALITEVLLMHWPMEEAKQITAC